MRGSLYEDSIEVAQLTLRKATNDARNRCAALSTSDSFSCKNDAVPLRRWSDDEIAWETGSWFFTEDACERRRNRDGETPWKPSQSCRSSASESESLDESGRAADAFFRKPRVVHLLARSSSSKTVSCEEWKLTPVNGNHVGFFFHTPASRQPMRGRYYEWDAAHGCLSLGQEKSGVSADELAKALPDALGESAANLQARSSTLSDAYWLLDGAAWFLSKKACEAAQSWPQASEYASEFD